MKIKIFQMKLSSLHRVIYVAYVFPYCKTSSLRKGKNKLEKHAHKERNQLNMQISRCICGFFSSNTFSFMELIIFSKS